MFVSVFIFLMEAGTTTFNRNYTTGLRLMVVIPDEHADTKESQHKLEDYDENIIHISYFLNTR